MGRGATKAAEAQQGTEVANANQYGNQAAGVYGKLFPQLESQYSNPQGFGQSDLNSMNTGIQQGAGGALASVKGEAANRAARTRNVGSYAPLLDAATINSEKQANQGQLAVAGENAKLKAAQQQAALAGEQGLYGTNVNAQLGNLGAANGSLGAWNQADANTTNAALGWAKFAASLVGAGNPGSGLGIG